MYERLDAIEQRYRELEEKLSARETAKDTSQFQALAKEMAGLQEIVETYRTLKKTKLEHEEVKRLSAEASDRDMIKLYEEEAAVLAGKQSAFEQKLENLLLMESDQGMTDKAVLVEIRAGTGGEEAALFAADLFRMYTRYANRLGLDVDIMSSNPTELGGFKEVIFEVSGCAAFGKFRFESGVHRVQRVPNTEASGRIHTSAVTVAVLPEADEVEVNIDPKDIRIDVFRSGGPGGQSVNTTDSAVRVTHLPTGMMVSCQDEKSQHKNKAKALKILRTRLFDYYRTKQQAERASSRREQVKTGDRSEKIRTYNFPDRRVTDHRIKLTVHNLEEVLEGELAVIVEALENADRKERLSKKEPAA
ncbi:MAG: peptide chain release factor 1 [Candidatus Omnitrophica bacterium]|nr:peptide chain release factor 1 [Candidatus Omnitrophota bacterium]